MKKQTSRKGRPPATSRGAGAATLLDADVPMEERGMEAAAIGDAARGAGDAAADDFIMKPKVDFAFKEIMENEKARVGFLSAVLKIRPEDVREAKILNSGLRKGHKDDKLGRACPSEARAFSTCGF